MYTLVTCRILCYNLPANGDIAKVGRFSHGALMDRIRHYGADRRWQHIARLRELYILRELMPPPLAV